MATKLNISTAIDPRWSTLAAEIRSHELWTLPDQQQPTIHIRRKGDKGISFSCWMFDPSTGINQWRNTATPPEWNDTTETSRRIIAALDNSLELALFSRAIAAEIEECDPEGLIYDEEPSNQPWSTLLPPPMRAMIDLGIATCSGGHFEMDMVELGATYDIRYQENIPTHHTVEMFELNAPAYRYFYGKSQHYIRVFNCSLPLTAEHSIAQLPLSQVVDIKFFHHPSLVVTQVEKKGADLMLHMPRILCPSARPPS